MSNSGIGTYTIIFLGSVYPTLILNILNSQNREQVLDTYKTTGETVFESQFQKSFSTEEREMRCG
jgi:hypothetical protein